MWQSPNQRIRALAEAKRREKEKKSRIFHIKRVLADLRLVNVQPGQKAEVVQCRLVLNDLIAQGVNLFSTQPLPVGSDVALSFSDPKPAYLRGQIVNCQEFDVDSSIISQKSYSYRIGIRFTFQNAEEETAIKNLIRELQGEELFGKKKAA